MIDWLSEEIPSRGGLIEKEAKTLFVDSKQFYCKKSDCKKSETLSSC